ncbi:MAG: gliding motility-associated C-terminal domain-containing protein [Elusimicrobia bacterium]|nr:gliding motility-associated C-terminal domain-containing protein [Elusimicrobiota bacterium]
MKKQNLSLSGIMSLAKRALRLQFFFVRSLFLLITLSPFPYTLYPTPFLYAARISGQNFTDIIGGIGYGSKSGSSSNFESFSSLEDISFSSGITGGQSLRAGILSYFPMPSSVSDITAVIVSTYSIQLTWNAPSADWRTGAGQTEKYLLRYSSVSTITGDYDFLKAAEYSQAWQPLSPGAGETYIIEGFNPATTYYFAIESINSHYLRSELSNSAAAVALVPLPPMNFDLQTSGNLVNLSWLHPTGYSTRIRFSDRFNPIYPYEISAYQIFRATFSAAESWQFIAEVSSSALQWTDTVDLGQGEYFYHIKAVNKAGQSNPSYVRGSVAGKAYYVAPDYGAMLEIPREGLAKFVSGETDQMKTYTVEISSHGEDIGGRVVKSVEFAAYKGGIEKESNFKLDKLSTVSLYYNKSGDLITSSAIPDYKRISLFYYNGARWYQLYGKVDETNRKIQVETTLLGKYQIRTVERLGAFSADISGRSNQLITPNNDGKNDGMVFVFDNPRSSAVKGKIFDLKGAFVADMRQGPVADSLLWDAKAEGQTVPGGVYVYQIEAEGKVFNGTVAVIK